MTAAQPIAEADPRSSSEGRWQADYPTPLRCGGASSRAAF